MHTQRIFLDFLQELESMDPPCACQWTPPFERMAPLANGPPLSKEETWPGPLTRGGGWYEASALAGRVNCVIYKQFMWVWCSTAQRTGGGSQNADGKTRILALLRYPSRSHIFRFLGANAGPLHSACGSFDKHGIKHDSTFAEDSG